MKNNDPDELTLFPVTGWTIGTLPALDAIFVQLSFLSSPLQTNEESDPGRRYVFQPSQLRKLRDCISESLQKLENAGYQAPPGGIQ